MEMLCTLFDTVSGVGELLGRSEEKCAELSKLVSTVGTLSQSVRFFAEDLAPDETEFAFQSNQVFAQLMSHMQECNAIISKHQIPMAAIEQPGGSGGRKSLGDIARSAVKASWQKGSRTLNEGLELLSGKIGSFGQGLLNLPEDELDVIRKACEELGRLVPLLALAIQVFQQRGAKRAMEQAAAYSMPPPQVPRLEFIATSIEDVPELCLQLVSDHPSAKEGPPLPALGTRQLRKRAGCSSSSLDQVDTKENPDACRLAFGRLDLKDKVPRSITLTPKGAEAPQPLQRFVSRDQFVLDVPRKRPEPPAGGGDECNDATLQMGGSDSAEMDFATLQFGADDGSGPPAPLLPPLAAAMGMTQTGLHLRRKGEKSWCWNPKGTKVDVHEGDCIGILLESPPGSSTPGPARDLGEAEATCLLGMEVHAPTPV